MSKANGFLQLRRGLWEHVRDGSLTHRGAIVYIYMLSQADTRTGVWKGSAQCIASALNIPKSTAKYALKGLDGRYIKRFPVPGRHFCYPILLHRFVPTQGQHVGLMLDALSSTSEKDLKFFELTQETADVPEVVQHVGPQRIREKREEIRKAASPPADARFGPFLEFAKGSFEAKHKRQPTWDCFGRDGKALADFLRRAPHVTLETWQVHLGNYFESTERFTLKQGGSLSYFISKFDAFASGPILEGKNGSAKKLAGDDLTKANLRAAGFVQ